MDLERICQATEVPVAALARALFPHHEYPLHALKYVGKSKHGLTPEQLATVINMTGKTEAELKQLSDIPVTPVKGGWSWRPDALKSVFYKDKWRADYYPSTNVAYLFKDGELVSDHILVAQTITLRQFIADMEELIGKY